MKSYASEDAVNNEAIQEINPEKKVGIEGCSANDNVALIPVTAIGASAGGLEPIEAFFDVMPTDSGCAFIIVQHLSPDFRSLMDELLARHSNMNIHRVTDNMEIEPNSIYLNPPRAVMTIEGNNLRVVKLDNRNVMYLPIDLFFQSLAHSRVDSAIGIILSGTGSDGTKGAQDIVSLGGTVLVQDPETTKFDGMPKSVIDTGCFDLIASPHDLAESVGRILKEESLDGLSASAREPLDEPLQDLLSMLKHRYGTDFSQYKDATVKRRIERRAQMRRIADINDYRSLVNKDEIELQELYADLLIEVTEFFRDVEAFDLLREQVIPELMRDMKDGDPVRVWVPGCASGEEAYSLAILLQEQARSQGIYPQFKIMATDIHTRSMNKASAGIYSEEALKGVPIDLISRYFDSADGQVQVKAGIRNMIFFSTHDVMRDPPFARIDLISCRNLLIYLKEEAQQKVMTLLHFSLRMRGILFLGPSEHIGLISHEFAAVSEKWRIYSKKRDIKLLPAESIFQRVEAPISIAISPNRTATSSIARSSKPDIDLSVPFRRARRAALENIVSQYAPPGFLLTENGEVVHIFGDAGDLLPMRSGSFSKYIPDLVRSDLKVIVTAALDQSRTVEFNGFKRVAYVKDENQESKNYEVALQLLSLQGESQRFLLLSIQEQDKPLKESVAGLPTEYSSDESSGVLHQRIIMLEHSLQSSEESLQSTIEELETTNEELQSTNEELMSTNEELQSTNEELHSVNEELYTVSAEHQRKNTELIEIDKDLDILLDLSKIGTIHLDEELNLLRYTDKAKDLFNMLPQDKGRPFQHITTKASNYDVFAKIDEVRDTRTTVETQLEADDNVYLVRIIPHLKDDGMTKGVLLTVIDITDRHRTRSQLEELNEQYKDIVDNTDSFIVRWNAETHLISYCNEQYASRWGREAKDLVGQSVLELRTEEKHNEFLDLLVSTEPNSSHAGVFTVSDHNGFMRSARVVTKGISKDGIKIDEYQAIGNDCTEEQRYRETIDRLFDTFTDPDREIDDKLSSILSIGLEHFELDVAIISMVSGADYTVRSIVSTEPVPYESGTVFNLQDTFCGQFIEKTACLAVADVSTSEFNSSPCHLKTGIESFIGVSLQTANGPYGGLSFSSSSARIKDFTVGDESLSMLIAGWIGYLLGNIEQLEFLSSKNDYYQTLLQNVPAMMFLSDSNGLVLSATDELTSKIGLKPENAPGMNCVEFFQPDDSSKVKSLVESDVGYCLPAKMIDTTGAPLDVELSMIIKPSGILRGVRMVVAFDVSERNHASRLAEAQNKRLEIANENLNQYAFIASHDLQEPLRKIQQFGSFLEEDMADDITEDGRYHLNVIMDAAMRMSALISDLLLYSSATQVEPDMAEVNLNSLIQDVLQDLDFRINESKADIVVSDLPTISGNELLIKQLFSNLFSNAIKYRSLERPLEIRVYGVGSKFDEGVIVADNGIGFDMSYAKKIFEPFNRLHSNKEYKGSGIGLAICKTVCDKHKWGLNVASESDKGSKFDISF